MVPFVGREVWYYPRGVSQIALGAPPLAAIVTRIWSPLVLNLAVFTADGNILLDPPTSIRKWEKGAEAVTMTEPLWCFPGETTAARQPDRDDDACCEYPMKIDVPKCAPPVA